MILKLKRASLILALLSCITLTSCMRTHIANLQRTADNEVEVFTTKKPTKEYIELKYIRIDGSVYNKPEKLLSRLSKIAKEQGADAVINIRYTFKSTWSMITGTAIKYKK